METYFFTVFAVFSFALGCCVASFLNVCIWRLPRGESVVRPRSHCPVCGTLIRWWQNIPLVSWLALRGRCAGCGAPISARYFIVELLGGVLFLLSYLQWGVPAFLGGAAPLGMWGAADPCRVAVQWVAATGLILASFIDLDHFYLPDRVTIGGMILGVPLSFCVPELQGFTGAPRFHLPALLLSAAGMAGGFLFFWLVGTVFSRLFKKEALGFGDVKLLGAIGAFFGPVAALFTVVVSAFAGSLAGLLLIARGKARLGGFTAVPYGPFLAAGVVVWMHWGPPVVNWYLHLYAVGD